MNLVCFAEVHYLDTNYLLAIRYNKESSICTVSFYNIGSGSVCGGTYWIHKRISKKYKHSYILRLVRDYLISDCRFEYPNYFIPENHEFTKEDIIGMFSEYWPKRAYAEILGKNLSLEKVEITGIIQRYIT